MMQVLAAVPIAGLEPVLVAVELVLESGSLSADHILNVVARLTSTTPPPCVETTLQLKVAPVAHTARSDRLRATDEENRNARPNDATQRTSPARHGQRMGRHGLRRHNIGRASGRARVCTDGQITVVAETGKTK